MFRVLVFLLLVSSCVHSFAAEIESVRLWRAPDSTRIVFDLSAPVEHKLFTLKKPERVVIDIQQAQVGKAFKDIDLADTPISKIRYGKRNGDDVRIVLDLSASTIPRSFVLKKHGGKPDRLVLDLEDQKSKVPTQKIQDLSDLIPDRRDIVIAVDAGHGGEDPGAIGPGKVLEKNIVLAISKQLVGMINAESGYSAFLVRTGDYYIPLRERRNKAREMRADLFVSIHADAFKDPAAKGASVFALSRRGATSETARFLAQKENEADLIGGVGGVDLKDVDDVLASVLVDLSMNATMSNSLNIGSQVLGEMGRFTRLHKKQVEQAGFAVLKSPDVPSILVETGFISNPQEAQKLNTYGHRRKLATAIFNGIRSYFNATPPADSYIAWKKKNGSSKANTEHVIAQGDTLSGIALRYNVSLTSLLKHNGLSRSAIIKVGQKLRIPAT